MNIKGYQKLKRRRIIWQPLKMRGLMGKLCLKQEYIVGSPFFSYGLLRVLWLLSIDQNLTTIEQQPGLPCHAIILRIPFLHCGVYDPFILYSIFVYTAGLYFSQTLFVKVSIQPRLSLLLPLPAYNIEIFPKTLQLTGWIWNQRDTETYSYLGSKSSHGAYSERDKRGDEEEKRVSEHQVKAVTNCNWLNKKWGSQKEQLTSSLPFKLIKLQGR